MRLIRKSNRIKKGGMMSKIIRYELFGYMQAYTWYGERVYKWLLIKTGESGLEKIKKDPLQDYIDFGVASVEYVHFEVYKTERWEDDKYFYERRTKEPVEEIEAGEPIIELKDMPYCHDCAVVDY